ncbi:hypothetical protein N7539_002763 [Penicillium diatomitis]|uniref:Trafficking protein particle complex subunit 10 n=1 Tax=Penicillium diatomitis TaxID=2819901 RepID=A0A9W9XFB6_9EURO|nr:uncharacterized protein N7539_002763 [Penicillium diatomitis]KAJ5491196.1 hypothetical protein N7539_002763 [Penicillium diatomitis]
MDSSKAASSNVTVEYTDPFGLFPLVQPIIESKLPLKNLHWKSPTRPVRSIESLRIGFSRAQTESTERHLSSDDKGPVSHRRHQIPGLRQTPYLKIYLLRCDDNETYKATARKTLREWIKAHGSPSGTQPTGGSSQEKHDAFDWLILHVVQDNEGAERNASSTSKWGRGSTTVLEKIKADFNGTSKSAPDRVAQLRAPKEGVSAKSPELADQLEDLIDKIKKGILASFDLRVAQYEEDIKEKDSQRSLPGWNFCTFFILKEGLARGFENVGLFEDALLGYDELSFGLDAAIRDQLYGSGEQHGTTLSNSSKEWTEAARELLSSDVLISDGGENPEAASLDISPEQFPLSASKLPYREMILASDISLFDFRTYVFARQLTLLLRAARAPSIFTGEMAKREWKAEDFMLLAEICSRSLDFISLAARNLRYVLECALEDVTNPSKTGVINNLVSTWAYSAALQILNQTFTPNLALPESTIHATSQAGKAASRAASMSESRSEIPRRSSSLIGPVTNLALRPVTQDLSDTPTGPMQRRSTLDHSKPAPKMPPKTGSEQLASARGELWLLARRCLTEIAQRRGWSENWSDLNLLFGDNLGSISAVTSGFAEVSLGDKPATEPRDSTERQETTLVGVNFPALKAGLQSKQRFLSLYEELTDEMIRHFAVANRANSTETALADIAILRYREGDYETAASYFHRMVPFFGSKSWTVLEGSMLELYARCLKQLGRNEDYVHVMLRLLAKFATFAQSKLTVRERSLATPPSILQLEQLAGYVADLFNGASNMQNDITAPLTDYFADLRIDPAIQIFGDRDGFQILVSLRFLVGPQVGIDSVKVRLVSESGVQHSEHWIESSKACVVKSSRTVLRVDSTITLHGKYFVDRIELKSGNITFSFDSGSHSALPVGFRESDEGAEGDKRPYVYCYPAPGGLQAKVVSPRLINLEAMRALELELQSGRDEISSGTIRVRPATAGLRLRIAEVEVVDGGVQVKSDPDLGTIGFAKLSAQSSVRLRIPYTVEEAYTTLSARTEINYKTDHGDFSFSTTHNIVAALPISVNVQDIFKETILFSRFTISPAMLVPLRITNCSLPSSDVYEVESSVTGPVAMDVFPKQPGSLLYKIRPTESTSIFNGNGAAAPRSLRLRVDFTCVDDECFAAVENLFLSAIQSSPFAQYATLLAPHIVNSFRAQLSTADLEAIGLVREVEMLSYQSVRWEPLLSALKEPIENMRQWLSGWHQSNPIIRLPDQASTLTRSIIIPVDIPEIQVVHTAELRVRPDESGARHPHAPIPHVAVGQLIAAELRIRHTRRWCSPTNRVHADQPLECSYEIHANPDQWLLGGRRRGNLLAREGETTHFTILLLPQKPGHLLLPGLEIRTFAPPTPSTNPSVSSPTADVMGGGATGSGQRQAIACEVDYRNHSDSVLVLPDLRKTTVSLSASGSPGGSSWLVDSERRVEA